jgi:hypothetical protein
LFENTKTVVHGKRLEQNSQAENVYFECFTFVFDDIMIFVAKNGGKSEEANIFEGRWIMDVNKTGVNVQNREFFPKKLFVENCFCEIDFLLG